ncbi:hypothetical protein [Crenobacter luteus]|nr:hypothetical protein [Crenobacter luteus]
MRTACAAMLLAGGLLAGCASDMTVRLASPAPASAPALATVKVNDLRAPGVAASKREAAFGVPMGNIAFNPPEAQVVQHLLETELSRKLAASGGRGARSYECDLIEFGANTVTTPLYWDVVGRVRLALKADGKKLDLRGEKTERTYLWPGESVVASTVEGALEQIARQVREADLP